jgi:asparagine synthase (glutamine-hydrolysing)
VCGLAGHYGPRELAPPIVERTLRLMRHRGPDDQSHERHRTPAGDLADLLHARLTIIDLDPRSNQPFHRGSLSLSYNGELYNYVELRAELEREGVRFATSSDTEVLLAAIERWGWEALERCEGMWAFAAYDSATGVLRLCRDRFGEKPLLVFRDGADTFFGSEAKLVFGLLERTPPPNLTHLQRYLVNGYKSLHKTEETFFEGLRQLPPGTVLELSPGGEREWRYWTPPAPVAADMSFEDAVAGARQRLIRSVELRLRADVPLAFAMSGGVDSMSLISTAQRLCGYDVHGFTIMNEDSRYEEKDMIDLGVAELGLRHTPVELRTDGFLPRLRELVRHHDAPVYTISHYVQWLLMEAIHEGGYRVSVSGTAADELFSGYYDHHLLYLREVASEPDLHGRSRAAWEEHVRPVVRNPYLSDPDRFVAEPGFREHIYLNADEFRERLCDGFDEPFAETDYGPDLLRKRMLNELFAEAVPVILHEEDLNAMSYSIENRSPFLDRDLFEFSLTIPTRHLVRDGRAKAVLREAMRGIAPDAVLDSRRKVGFNAPIRALLDTADPAVRAELLADSPIFDVVRREPVEQLLSSREELPNSESKFLFYFVCAKLFLEEVAGAAP